MNTKTLLKKNICDVRTLLIIGAAVVLIINLCSCSFMGSLDENENMVDDSFIAAPLRVNPKTFDAQIGFIGANRFFRWKSGESFVWGKKVESTFFTPAYTYLMATNPKGDKMSLTIDGITLEMNEKTSAEIVSDKESTIVTIPKAEK